MRRSFGVLTVTVAATGALLAAPAVAGAAPSHNLSHGRATTPSLTCVTGLVQGVLADVTTLLQPVTTLLPITTSSSGA